MATNGSPSDSAIQARSVSSPVATLADAGDTDGGTAPQLAVAANANAIATWELGHGYGRTWRVRAAASTRVHARWAGHPVGMGSPHDGASELYVALGDSISIDVYAGGRGRGGASLLARNRDSDFPHWRRRDLATTRPELGFLLLASDAATTASLLDVQLPRLQSSAGVPRVVTLTVGGNDILSAYGNTRLALEIVGVVGGRVARALDRLHALVAPQDPIVLGTVYDPSDGTGQAWRVGLPPWHDVVDVLAELNATLRAVAREHGAVVADIHGRFMGHGLQAGNPAQPGARPAERALWYCNIIEPNAWGADAVRAAFWAALQEHDELQAA